MNRILLILLFFCAGLSACKKSTADADRAKAQAVIDDKIIKDYLAANNLPENHVDDTTGVCYVIINPGAGTDLFTNSTQVTLGYTGKILTTGKIFAQSGDFNPSFVLGSVIRGWQLGIPQINKGGEVRLFIPSRYAYGPFDQPQIGLPANSVLDFDIRLYDVTN